jgi:predicted NAD-dependent protein-ADP-ribosyltransferase YbiA (DUF1768 family)
MYRIKGGIELDGINWISTESYYQAMKFKGSELFNKFIDINGPESKKLANENKDKIRSDWDSVKDEVMWKCIDTKFNNIELALKLYSVKGEIVENNYWGDVYWGVCKGIGENRLGKLLMMKRDKLRKELLNR